MISLWPRSDVAALAPSSHPTVLGAGVFPALSVALHAVVLVAGVALTDSPPGLEGAREHPVFYLFPPDRVASEPGAVERVRYVRTDLPAASGTMGDAPEVKRAASAPHRAAKPDSITSAAAQPQAGNDSVYSVLDVDSAARRYPWSAAPVYPPAMLVRGIEGAVATQYVVDTTGLADTASFRVSSSTDPEFTAAVRAALPGMRFVPAKIGKEPVRLLVQQTFSFRLRLGERAKGTSKDTSNVRDTTVASAAGKPRAPAVKPPSP